jgi:hypothetical protein
MSNSKGILAKAITILLGRLDREMSGAGLPYKKMIFDQFRPNLVGMVSRYDVDKSLCRDIENLMYVVEEGS